MRPRLLVLALAALALPACAGKLEQATRTQAAADFSCPADQLTVRGDEVYGKYYVSGCGQKGVYSAQCLMGKCSAERLQGE
ncbi:MAG TPA: hypothetical protein VIK91_25890 [Nannocystis sp.]